MENLYSNIEQVVLMFMVLMSVIAILASPVWVALLQTDRVMKVRYPKIKPKTIEVVKPRNESSSVGHTEPTVVTKTPLLPYDHPEVRKPRDHILDKFRDVLNGRVDIALADLYKHEGEEVRVAGFVTDVRVFQNRQHEHIANAAITDPSGGAEVIIYSAAWIATPIDRGEIVVVKGKTKEGKILASNIEQVGEVTFGNLTN